MNHHLERLKISRTSLVLVAFGLLAIAAILLVRTVHPPLTAGDRDLRALVEQAAQLEQYSDAALERSTQVKDAAVRALWSDATVDAWRQKLPSKWTVTEYGTTEGVRTIAHRYLLTRTEAASRDYHELLEVIRSCSSLVGVRLQNVVIASADHRRFDQAQILICFSYPK